MQDFSICLAGLTISHTIEFESFGSKYVNESGENVTEEHAACVFL
jgi:hypothetical protein